MIVDVVLEDGKQWMRYTTDCLPRIGDTISTLRPEKKEFEVLSIDHLVNPKPLSDDMRQDLATVTVCEN